MLFKNPELLYFLFLLIIPILIHLFQLQRFQKTAFTNVKFLKEIEQQTRKSSKLKKLLILITRILLFTSLILAFAQPHLKNENKNLNSKTFIYLDNSFSMQLKGENGEQLEKIKNDLIENLSSNNKVTTLITNNHVSEDLNFNNFKNEILKIKYYPIKKSLETVLLQINTIKNKSTNTQVNTILISDFQNINYLHNKLELDSLTKYSFVQPQAKNIENISIDSIWVSDKNRDNLTLNSIIKSYDIAVENLSVSLFVNNELFGKTTVSLDKNESKTVEFILLNSDQINGRLSLNDHKLPFDDNLYFSIPKKEKINVLAIGPNNDFLSKIYTKDEFVFLSTTKDQLDFNMISNQQLIVLNEIDVLSQSLIQTLSSYVKNNGNLVIIPSLNSDINNYNTLFSLIQLGKIDAISDSQKTITTINYNHPFFKSVFQKQISNFQYPTVNTIFETNLRSASSLLKFNDQSSFISEIRSNNNKIYWFSAPINIKNSNFTLSPLVVPVFYNFSLQNQSVNDLYYTIGNRNSIFVKTQINDDEVLHITKKGSDFIPLQVKKPNSTQIQTEENPSVEGIYQIKNNDHVIRDIAYNYNREESDLSSNLMEQIKNKYENVQFFTSVNNAIQEVNDQYINRNLWQLFIIFALLFLGLEILLQKFLKN